MTKIAEPGAKWKYDRTVDEIGPWSEVKLEILRRYASEYSKILSKNKNLKHIYIDAFAGAGVHMSRTSRNLVLGSPLNALQVKPPFEEYHFIELDANKVGELYKRAGERKDIYIYEGDCNKILLEKVFPKARYEDYTRALCLLDPYGLHLNWEVIKTAGQSRSIEVFINFPILDINRNVLRKNPDERDPVQEKRMNFFWGDDSWKESSYEAKTCLFGEVEEKVDNEKVAEAFRIRLKEVAGFKEVPKPCPMKNNKGAVVYYLYFASAKSVASKIVEHIFKKFGGA